MKLSSKEYQEIKELILNSDLAIDTIVMTKKKGWITLSHPERKNSIGFIRRRTSSLNVVTNSLTEMNHYDLRHMNRTIEQEKSWDDVLDLIDLWSKTTT